LQHGFAGRRNGVEKEREGSDGVACVAACSVKKIREQGDALDQTELGWVLRI
jgi:hypothetical protein